MKLKDIENPEKMTINELNNLFRRWFPDGIRKEEGWVVWSIFSNNNRYLHIISNKIIETGTFRFFGSFLSEICNEESDYMDFYDCVINLEYIDIEIIKKIHRIVNLDIKFIENYWNDENSKIK